MKKITDFFFKNFQAKVVCVLLALVLWVYVGTGLTKTAEFPGQIPLDIKNVPQGLVAVTDTDTITVKVVADSSIFQKLSNDSFKAYLDLTGYKAGTYQIKPTVTVSQANVAIVETNPAQITISLEPSIQKDVPVAVQVDGKAGDGLVAGQTTADPNHVTVAGAKSVIESMQTATAKITLNGETSDFKKMTKLVSLDAKGKDIKNLTFTPAEVIVNVPIVKASNVKTVGIKVNTTGNPANGYWISQITTEPMTVTVTASEATVTQLTYIGTAPVSINDLNKNTTINTTLAPPAGVSVLDKIEQVKVTITVSKNQATKQIDTGFKWQGLASNLKVTSVDPSSVKVVVTGPQDVLSGLSSDDISIVVDLSGNNAPGTYSVDISRSSISGPTGVSVSSVVPSAINVRLDTK
jgi:YbbR domain-containing protein